MQTFPELFSINFDERFQCRSKQMEQSEDIENPYMIYSSFHPAIIQKTAG